MPGVTEIHAIVPQGIPKRRFDERQPRTEDLGQHGPVDGSALGTADIRQRNYRSR